MTDPSTLPPLPESKLVRQLVQLTRMLDPDSRLLALRSLIEAARGDLPGHRSPLPPMLGPCNDTRLALVLEMERFAAFLNPGRGAGSSPANPPETA